MLGQAVNIISWQTARSTHVQWTVFSAALKSTCTLFYIVSYPNRGSCQLLINVCFIIKL